MNIRLSRDEIEAHRSGIDAAMRGEMCKIMNLENLNTGETEHFVFPACPGSGWCFNDGESFHGNQTDGPWHKTGLGTFYLITATDTDDGGMELHFTDDLNPELP